MTYLSDESIFFSRKPCGRLLVQLAAVRLSHIYCKSGWLSPSRSCPKSDLKRVDPARTKGRPLTDFPSLSSKVARTLEVGLVLRCGRFPGFRTAFEPNEIMWDLNTDQFLEYAPAIDDGKFGCWGTRHVARLPCLNGADILGAEKITSRLPATMSLRRRNNCYRHVHSLPALFLRCPSPHPGSPTDPMRKAATPQVFTLCGSWTASCC